MVGVRVPVLELVVSPQVLLSKTMLEPSESCLCLLINAINDV